MQMSHAPVTLNVQNYSASLNRDLPIIAGIPKIVKVI